MTPRERLLTAMSHRRPDRTPTVIAIRGEAQRALQDHYGVGSFEQVRAILGIEEYVEVEPRIDFSGYAEKINGRLEGDCPFSGRELYFHDERTFEDGWGVVRRVGRDGRYVEWVSGPLEHASDPDEYAFPQAEWIADEPDLPDRIRRLEGQGLLTRCLVANPYKTAWSLRGMENILADYLVNRSFVEKLYDRIYAFAGHVLRRATAAGVDVIGVEGDFAMQDRIIMGPDRWREVDKPRLARLIASCKEINPDVHVFIHSDGNLMELMPDLIEVGIDVVDSLQPECIDPFEVKRRFGDRITLHGCGSLQKVLPYGTPEECRREVEELVERCGADGGLILRPSNMIGWDVPIENIIAWYETARDTDLSRLSPSWVG